MAASAPVHYLRVLVKGSRPRDPIPKSCLSETVLNSQGSAFWWLHSLYDAALAVVYTVYECLHTPCTLLMTFKETQFLSLVRLDDSLGFFV